MGRIAEGGARNISGSESGDVSPLTDHARVELRVEDPELWRAVGQGTVNRILLLGSKMRGKIFFERKAEY